MSVSDRQRGPGPAEVWSAGDYADVCDRMIPGLGARLVELAGVRPGDEVLDVASGSGNAALPAAQAGAIVAALDITPTLLQAGSRRAAAAGLEIEWVHADAQAMPFAEASFDRVLSCVGVQFCADQRAAAAELVRVCRPGGRVALIAWTPEGFIGRILATVARATGAAAPSPPNWGSETGVTGLLGGRTEQLALKREHVVMSADSPSGWVDYMAATYGPLVRARTMLQARDGWESVRSELVSIAAAHGTDDGDAFSMRAEYLTATLDR